MIKSVLVEWQQDGLKTTDDPDLPDTPIKDPTDMRGAVVCNYRSAQFEIVGSYRFLSDHAGAELFAMDPENSRSKPPKSLKWVIPRLRPGITIVAHNWMTKTPLQFEPDGPKVIGNRHLPAEKMAVLTWGPRDTVKITGECV